MNERTILLYACAAKLIGRLIMRTDFMKETQAELTTSNPNYANEECCALQYESDFKYENLYLKQRVWYKPSSG